VTPSCAGQRGDGGLRVIELTFEVGLDDVACAMTPA
jgi:hypothetical protein